MTSDRFIDLAELRRLLCMSRAAIYQRHANDPTFPRIIKIGRKTVFLTSAAETWMKARIEESAKR